LLFIHREVILMAGVGEEFVYARQTALSRESRFKELIAPFTWAFRACLMAALFGFSLATDPTFISVNYVVAGLIASLLAVSGLVAWGMIRMRAAYEG
jgi:hypothetical protein